jgi:flagellar basal body rod protein FlgB
MELKQVISDNICEVLVKIIEFTNTRQKILTENLNNIHKPGFVPKDLAVNEFSVLLGAAIEEHKRNKRLVLCDTENIKFGIDGSFKADAVEDKTAEILFKERKTEYLELQINKLLENSINQRLAAELLKYKQQMISIGD